jgi:hypothetical protein
MKKIVLVYGLIAGFIVGGMILVSIPLWQNEILNFDNGELVGYTTMVIALSMVFFGIKSYRDNYSKGVITFWGGCKVGLLITLVASICYALSWEVSFATMGDEFTQQMTDHYFQEMKDGGATEAELQQAKKDWDAFAEMYKNPIIRFGVTLMEILPVGLAISLLSAGLLRKKEFLPPTTANS